MNKVWINHKVIPPKIKEEEEDDEKQKWNKIKIRVRIRKSVATTNEKNVLLCSRELFEYSGHVRDFRFRLECFISNTLVCCRRRHFSGRNISIHHFILLSLLHQLYTKCSVHAMFLCCYWFHKRRHVRWVVLHQNVFVYCTRFGSKAFQHLIIRWWWVQSIFIVALPNRCSYPDPLNGSESSISFIGQANGFVFHIMQCIK